MRKPHVSKVTLTIPSRVHQALKERAESDGLRLSALCTDFLAKGLGIPALTESDYAQQTSLAIQNVLDEAGETYE